MKTHKADSHVTFTYQSFDGEQGTLHFEVFLSFFVVVEEEEDFNPTNPNCKIYCYLDAATYEMIRVFSNTLEKRGIVNHVNLRDKNFSRS